MTKPAIFPSVNSWLVPLISEDLAIKTSLNLDVISYQNKYLVSLSTDNKLGVFIEASPKQSLSVVQDPFCSSDYSFELKDLLYVNEDQVFLHALTEFLLQKLIKYNIIVPYTKVILAHSLADISPSKHYCDSGKLIRCIIDQIDASLKKSRR